MKQNCQLNNCEKEDELQEIVADVAHGTTRSYIVGFILSLALTLAAYFVVSEKLVGNDILNYTISALALVQMVIQVLFFLHLGSESKPRWNQLTFLFMLIVIVIIIGGSLWIMANLIERTMPPMDMNEYLHHQE